MGPGIGPHPLVDGIVAALEDKKGIEIRVLDLRHLMDYADHLVLCTGSSTPHVHALVEAVRERFPGRTGPAYVNSSKDNSWWILDFVDVVVHVFSQEARSFYDLEALLGGPETP